MFGPIRSVCVGVGHTSAAFSGKRRDRGSALGPFGILEYTVAAVGVTGSVTSVLVVLIASFIFSEGHSLRCLLFEGGYLREQLSRGSRVLLIFAG